MDNDFLTEIKTISCDFDRSQTDLKNLLALSTDQIPHSVGKSETISKLSETISLIDTEIETIKQVLKGNQSVSQLKLRFSKLFERGKGDKSSNEPDQESISMSECFSTPQSKSSVNISQSQSEEDYPSTPTLEQLGLSGPTLSIVGGRRLGFDSSTSVSDNEFDNSFYGRSPLATVDNSFSSDVSVPNFRIIHSSPISNGKRPNILTGKTNLQQVTTALSDFDSSVLVDEEETSPKSLNKRVRFNTDENEISNN